MNAKILGLILARGGSKRVPGKNARSLGGKPLLAWTVEAAHASAVLKDVLLSTDDRSLANIGRTHGAMIPWLRPAHLATDTASSVDAALHALDWYESQYGRVDGLMLLQPTSPFRRADSIRNAAAQFEEDVTRGLVSLSLAPCHPAWCFKLDGNGGLKPYLGWDKIGVRSQDIEPAFVVNGAIYITPPERLRADRTFIAEDSLPFIMTDPTECLDIDTEPDWSRAEEKVTKG